MKKTFTLLLLCAFACVAHAQTTPTIQAYGKVDQADLNLKQCDFEKDANAEVLFDKGDVYLGEQELVFAKHVRIKIFNDNGKGAANIRFEFLGGNRFEWITNIQAETINSNNGVIEITKVDKKQIFTQVIDKELSVLTFSFPNVKPGSIIEYKFNVESPYASDFPDWYFQGDLPVRYSELTAKIPDYLHYKNLVRVTQPLAAMEKDNNGLITKIAMTNVPSITTEPRMSSVKDNLQCVLSQLLSITQTGGGGIGQNFSETWQKVGENEMGYEDFGDQFKRKLNGQDDILNHAKGLKSNDEKIAYIFNTVKNAMKWNDLYMRYTDDGTVKAWDKKLGNSTEINLIVYDLLSRAGIKAYPMLLSTRKHGKVNPAFSSRYQFNTSVTYIPIDSATYYILDATDKYNLYSVIPENLLNSYGLYIDKENKKSDLVFIQNTLPVRNVVYVNADIKPDGKMSGTAQISNFAYNRIDNIENYKTNGEKKYIDWLKGGNNDLQISSVKLENMDVDSLPLTQNINFNLDLTGSDGTYIYFKPNYSIVGSYKLPAGYKTDALPKNLRMDMSDQSIGFKRMVSEADGTITIRYTLVYKKTIFFKENYAELHEFYKKMYELLSEQIVLKKS